MFEDAFNRIRELQSTLAGIEQIAEEANALLARRSAHINKVVETASLVMHKETSAALEMIESAASLQKQSEIAMLFSKQSFDLKRGIESASVIRAEEAAKVSFSNAVDLHLKSIETRDATTGSIGLKGSFAKLTRINNLSDVDVCFGNYVGQIKYKSQKPYVQKPHIYLPEQTKVDSGQLHQICRNHVLAPSDTAQAEIFAACLLTPTFALANYQADKIALKSFLTIIYRLYKGSNRKRCQSRAVFTIILQKILHSSAWTIDHLTKPLALILSRCASQTQHLAFPSFFLPVVCGRQLLPA